MIAQIISRPMSLVLMVGAGLLAGSAAFAQSAEDFYKGKQVSFIIASGPGGGYDTYGRVMARHIGRNIPGKPNVVPQNMPGADGLQATNHLYNVAAKDGSVIGNTYNTAGFEPLFGGQAARFDPMKLTWFGSMGKQDLACVTWKDSPIKTIADAKAKKTRVSATGASGNRYIVPQIVNALVGTQFEVITGYDTSGAFLAVERGEVDGICGISYGTLQSTVPHWLQGKLNFLVQFAAKPHPEFGATPMMGSLVTDPKDKQLLDLVFAMQEIGRPIIAPPDLPADRLAALEKAFVDTMKDPEFRAEAEKVKLEVEIVTRAETMAVLKQAYATPPDIVKRVAQMIGRKE
jgi:tripartite-type tricarboxylate transporter receptor subunit TctC